MPRLNTLHWLSVRHRVICCITYQAPSCKPAIIFTFVAYSYYMYHMWTCPASIM